jgi:hypothetical protein
VIEEVYRLCLSWARMQAAGVTGKAIVANVKSLLGGFS